MGTAPADLIAAIGPAACGRNYEVGREVIEMFTGNFGECSRYFTPTREGHALVDLHAANRDQLLGERSRIGEHLGRSVLHDGAA